MLFSPHDADLCVRFILFKFSLTLAMTSNMSVNTVLRQENKGLGVSGFVQRLISIRAEIGISVFTVKHPDGHFWFCFCCAIAQASFDPTTLLPYCGFWITGHINIQLQLVLYVFVCSWSYWYGTRVEARVLSQESLFMELALCFRQSLPGPWLIC